MMLIVSCNMAKILTVSRKSHHPIDPFLYYSERIILKCELFGFDRVTFENEISPNFAQG